MKLLLTCCFFRLVTMLVVLTLFGFVLAMPATEFCPTTCQCLSNSSTLVCKEKQLQHIPTLPASTAELYVSYNQIQEIPEQDFGGLKVLNTTALTIFKKIKSHYILINMDLFVLTQYQMIQIYFSYVF